MDAYTAIEDEVLLRGLEEVERKILNKFITQEAAKNLIEKRDSIRQELLSRGYRID